MQNTEINQITTNLFELLEQSSSQDLENADKPSHYRNSQNSTSEIKRHSKSSHQQDLQICNYNIIFKNYDFALNLTQELYLSNEGLLRLFWAQNWFSFGYQPQEALNVQQNKKLGIVSVQYQQDNYFQVYSLDVALQYIQKIPQIQYEKVLPILQNYFESCSHVKKIIMPITAEIQRKKDQEFSIFTRLCHKYIEMFIHENENKMFSYTIGRVNLMLQDIQTLEIGFSKEYLNLIGINEESMRNIILRRHKIDLLQNIGDVTFQTLNQLEMINNPQQKYSKPVQVNHIVTFDGFLIKLYSQQIVLSELYKPLKNYGIPVEYILQIIQMDVDLSDLERLIEYRKNLSSQNITINLEDFIKRELSFQFEDVEYSVHSQSFVDKFYNKNIDELTILKQRIIKSKQQCKYRYINQNA